MKKNIVYHQTCIRQMVNTRIGPSHRPMDKIQFIIIIIVLNLKFQELPHTIT